MMKRIQTTYAIAWVALMSIAAQAATDGTWAKPTAGGSWSDAANWTGGVLPSDGGVARFDFNGFDYTINATGVETTLGGFSLSNTTPRDKEVIFNGGTFNLVPPARIDQTHGAFNFRGTLVCEGAPPCSPCRTSVRRFSSKSRNRRRSCVPTSGM